MITIDGKNYKATWLKPLEQTADILNGEKSGRLQGTHQMYLEYLGTFFNHKGELRRDADCTEAEWNELFLKLCNPVNKHTVSFPFGESQELTQEIYISSITRKLMFISETNRWERVYSVSFVAIGPAWRPNGNIKGLS